MSMQKMMNLRDMLCEELDKLSDRPELTNQMLEKVDLIVHALKNLDKVMESESSGYSRNGMSQRGYSMDDGYSRGNYSRDGEWNAQGNYSRRRYSRANESMVPPRDNMDDFAYRR